AGVGWSHTSVAGSRSPVRRPSRWRSWRPAAASRAGWTPPRTSGVAAAGPDAPAVLADLSPRSPAAAAAAPLDAAARTPGAWRERLAAVAPPERAAVLTELIRAEIAAVLGFTDPSELPAERAFTELGFDSLSAVQVRNRLSAFIRVRLSPTVVLEHPTLPELTAHVHGALLDAGALPGTETEASAAGRARPAE
ncbi:acyl carrier protein, partial [Streptomyces sp. 900105755]